MMTLPWTHDGNGLIFGQCAADDDEAPLIADVITDRERAPFGIMTDAEREHAEFIVTACNLHARLVAALRDLLGDRPDIQDGQCIKCGRDYRDEPALEFGTCPCDDCPAYEAHRLLAELEEVRS